MTPDAILWFTDFLSYVIVPLALIKIVWLMAHLSDSDWSVRYVRALAAFNLAACVAGFLLRPALNTEFIDTQTRDILALALRVLVLGTLIYSLGVALLRWRWGRGDPA